jgi:hypothetical protein
MRLLERELLVDGTILKVTYEIAGTTETDRIFCVHFGIHRRDTAVVSVELLGWYDKHEGTPHHSSGEEKRQVYEWATSFVLEDQDW